MKGTKYYAIYKLSEIDGETAIYCRHHMSLIESDQENEISVEIKGKNNPIANFVNMSYFLTKGV